jgi:ferredoxin-NADP reductase
MNSLDRLLNRLTTYRLVVYSLAILAAYGVLLAFLDRMAATPTQLMLSLLIVVAAAYATDRMLARVFRVPTNMESSLISALILFLIIQPAHSTMGGVVLALGGALSSASKFLIAWNGKHIFNPAAFAAAVLSLSGLQAATWWVGGSLFWPLSLVLGVAIARKIRKLSLPITFAAVTVTVQLMLFAVHGQLTALNVKHMLITSPLIFLATVMLTEPATMPPRRTLQLAYGGLVAVLYAAAWKFGPFTVHPEIALLLGNIVAFAVSPKTRVRLRLKEIRRVSDRIYDYVFQPDKPLAFLPGQYMEWTLAGVPYDARGNRRTFTIASSPTEQDVRLGLKFYEPASTYKAVMERLQPGAVVYGSQIAGNFVLHGNEHKKLAFIAGGIGITPFRSMVQYVVDQGLQVDIVLVYAVADAEEFAYLPELQAARELGVQVALVVTRESTEAHGVPGVISAQLDQALLARAVPDYAERLFYISGPNAMVEAAKGYLHGLNVPRMHIKSDHFSGY